MKVLREMADSRTEAGNIKGEPQDLLVPENKEVLKAKNKQTNKTKLLH